MLSAADALFLKDNPIIARRVQQMSNKKAGILKIFYFFRVLFFSDGAIIACHVQQMSNKKAGILKIFYFFRALFSLTGPL